jgi:hypothetical protein
MGFPRPLRSWPTCGMSFSRKREETPFYEFLSSKLSKALEDMQSEGTLQNILPGSTFLFRNDPLLAWLEVIEVGYDYEIIVVKGLELQTTSCHAVEVTHVDAMITAVEDHSLSKCQSLLSPNSFSVCHLDESHQPPLSCPPVILNTHLMSAVRDSTLDTHKSRHLSLRSSAS